MQQKKDNGCFKNAKKKHIYLNKKAQLQMN